MSFLSRNGFACGSFVCQFARRPLPQYKGTVDMNRARTGLLAGRVVQFGNNISEDGGNKCAALTWSK